MKKKVNYSSYLIKFCLTLMLFITVTFCWYVLTNDSSVNSLQIQTIGLVNVSIADENQENWSNEITLQSSKGKITEYSGNGKTLYSPITSSFNIDGFVIDEDSLILDSYDEDGNFIDKGFIEYVTYLRTDGPINFYLSPDSSIIPYNDKITNQAEKDKLDLIAGALRVAIIVEDSKPFVWAPNTTYQYDEVNNIYTKNGTPEDKFTYVYSPTNEQFLSTTSVVTIDNSELLPAGVSPDGRFVWGNLNEIRNYYSVVNPIFSTENQLSRQITLKMVIRIWVEGTDREAVKSIIGGKFMYNLHFMAFEK